MKCEQVHYRGAKAMKFVSNTIQIAVQIADKISDSKLANLSELNTFWFLAI